MTSSDERLRRLERRWRTTGSVDDGATWLRARLQAGAVRVETVRLAALAGDACARLALDDPPAVAPAGKPRAWLAAVEAAGPRASALVLLALTARDLDPSELSPGTREVASETLLVLDRWAIGTATRIEVEVARERARGAGVPRRLLQTCDAALDGGPDGRPALAELGSEDRVDLGVRGLVEGLARGVVAGGLPSLVAGALERSPVRPVPPPYTRQAEDAAAAPCAITALVLLWLAITAVQHLVQLERWAWWNVAFPALTLPLAAIVVPQALWIVPRAASSALRCWLERRGLRARAVRAASSPPDRPRGQC